jgi:glucose-6-phosphate isomerase
MLTKNIKIKNFKTKSNIKIKKIFKNFLLKKDDKLLQSFSENYKYSFNLKKIKKYKKYKNFTLIGMGGSILGAEAIYDFLNYKIGKKFTFINNLNSNIKKTSKNNLNIIISKSGNTLETISNSNVILGKNSKNLFITEDSQNYLMKLAYKLKSEIIEHRNYIGGRYSVLSEVGMVPAELMGLDIKKFKRLNHLINNKKFMRNIIQNVSAILLFAKRKKNLSVILNYDESSNKLFEWYQQLVSESLGKKSKGIIPLISTMPKDNHSLMQYFLDGPKNNFYTFYSVKDKKSQNIKTNLLLNSFSFIKNKNLSQIKEAQRMATENIFSKKKIPFRTIEIINKNEQSIGEIFTFFMLETILLGRALKVNPFDQPSVELIKKETKKIIIRG